MHVYELMAIIAANGTFRYTNPSYQRILGYRATELNGRSVFEHIHPDDLPPVLAAFTATLRSEGAPIPMTYRYRDSSGAWRPLETTGISHLAIPGLEGILFL